MSRKLKAFVEKDLYNRIKGLPVSGEESFMPVLRSWYEKCRTDHGIDDLSVQFEAFSFYTGLENRKAFEKAVEKNGYDVDYLLASIWKEFDAERILSALRQESRDAEEMRVQIRALKEQGAQSVGNTLLAEENNKLRAVLDEERARTAQLEEALKNKNSGGNKMAEITQWEYKTLDTNQGENIDKELKTLGEQGWELSGASRDGYSSYNTLIFKRPKQTNHQQIENEYDYNFYR